MAADPKDIQRLAQLKAAVAGRTSSDGTPRKGYTKNVAALRAEIASVQNRIDTAGKDA